MENFAPVTNLAANKALVINADATPPTLSSGIPSGSQSSGTTSVTLGVTTDEAATCKYGTIADTAYASIANTFSTTGGTTHTSTLTGLTNGTSYTYYVRCIDGSGNPTVSDYTVTFSVSSADTTPPTITSVFSNKDDGTYGVGEVIDIDVTFSEAVSGIATITLETGDNDRTCEITVSNSTTATCNYTVQA